MTMIPPLPSSDPDASRLSYLAQSLSRNAGSLKVVGYGQAEDDCARLAQQLLELYSHQELRSFSFVPIPRGGLIVLGMLSYILDLNAAQLQAGSDHSRPTVLVDDCALTGARFAQQLRRTPGEHILFAHLYSHPALRSAVLQREPRVKACLTAHDLADRAQEIHPDPQEYQAWQDRWSERLGPDRYWFGLPDLVCFAWTEPDYPFFNPVSERIEDGWRFVPPHLCLKNRTRLGLPPKSAVTRVWQAPQNVVSGIFDEVLWLVETTSQQVYKLTGVAADMWRGLAVYGSIEATVDYLSDVYEAGHPDLCRDVEAFAGTLCASGLLQPAVSNEHE